MIKAFLPAVLCIFIVVGAKAIDRWNCPKRPKAVFTETVNTNPIKFEYCSISDTGVKVCKHRGN